MNTIQQKISAIIFDVDGVLVDTVPFHFRAWQKAFSEAGIPFGHDEYQRINGLPRDEGVRVILQADVTLERTKKIGDLKQKYYMESLVKNSPEALPGIIHLLSEIHETGWRLAAASSSKNARNVLEAAGLTRDFDVIVTGNDFKKSKPDPDIFLTAASLLGASPSLTAIVEDAVNGVAAAKAGGFYCVAVANSESAENLKSAGASIVVRSTDELALKLFLI